jgi:hypothetical protein
MDRLDEIRARVEAATPGPWEWDDSEWHRGFYAQEGRPLGDRSIGELSAGDIDVLRAHIDEEYLTGRLADAAFIAAAREDVPWLLAQIRRLRRIELAAREYQQLGAYLRGHIGPPENNPATPAAWLAAGERLAAALAEPAPA